MTIDPAKTAFLFPGQGSQAVGMGRDLAEKYPAAREIFLRADEALGFALSEMMWNGPEAELNDTVNTQPALFVHSIAALRALQQRHAGLQPAILAGHSLGELSAIVAGEALAFKDGLRLVRTRGELMKKAGELSPGGMAAVLNLDIPAIEKVCEAASLPGETVQVANDNCPGQVVISGARPAVDRAIELAKAAGARRAVRLAVSIAAHSQLMDTIQAEWNDVVERAGIGDSRIPIISNVSARTIHLGAELRKDIQQQMQSRVRWTEAIEGAAKRGIDTFVEVGSGNVLLGLVKRIAPEARLLPAGTPADLEAVQ